MWSGKETLTDECGSRCAAGCFPGVRGRHGMLAEQGAWNIWRERSLFMWSRLENTPFSHGTRRCLWLMFSWWQGGIITAEVPK